MAAIKTRKRKPITDNKKHLNAVRKLTPTHILEIEIDVSEDNRRHLLGKGEHLRIIHNTVLGQVYSNYRQMTRTKIFKRTMKKYIKTSKQIKNGIKTKEKIQEKKKLTDTFEELRNQFNVTFDFVRKYGENLRKNNYSASDAVTTWSVCEKAWNSIEGLIYRGSKKVRFYKKGIFTTLQGKQANRSIMLKSGMIRFSGMSFPLIIKKDDLFIIESLANIETYNQDSVLINRKLVDNYLQDKPLPSTYRVRNNRIICKEIRGVNRYFAQVALEGNPVAKRNKDGSFRHTYGVGKLGGDIGTQSIGIVGHNDVILKNFAERSKNTLKLEHKIILLQRK